MDFPAAAAGTPLKAVAHIILSTYTILYVVGLCILCFVGVCIDATRASVCTAAHYATATGMLPHPMLLLQ